jgi:hypothetical protein
LIDSTINILLILSFIHSIILFFTLFFIRSFIRFIPHIYSVGKLQEGGMSSMDFMRSEVSGNIVNSVNAMQSNVSTVNSGVSVKAADALEQRQEADALRESFVLQRPRSNWMRSKVSREEYMDMAKCADFSSGEIIGENSANSGIRGIANSGENSANSGIRNASSSSAESKSSGANSGVNSSADSAEGGVKSTSDLNSSSQGRIPSLCKAAVELDRGAAIVESSPMYTVRLMKLLHADAGLRDDVLIGFPPRLGDLLEGHVCRVEQ